MYPPTFIHSYISAHTQKIQIYLHFLNCLYTNTQSRVFLTSTDIYINIHIHTWSQKMHIFQLSTNMHAFIHIHTYTHTPHIHNIHIHSHSYTLLSNIFAYSVYAFHLFIYSHVYIYIWHIQQTTNIFTYTYPQILTCSTYLQISTDWSLSHIFSGSIYLPYLHIFRCPYTFKYISHVPCIQWNTYAH